MADALEESSPEDWFHSLATHYVEAQIYFHLNQVGVLHHLTAELGRSVDEIAGELSLSARILDILLSYVANVGAIIERTERGSYRLTRFGHQVLRRYRKTNGDRESYNVFDVRVGAWGPLWQNLSALLDESMVYGRDLHRIGDYAADGLFKLAHPLAATVDAVATRFGLSSVVEIGPTSGILAELAQRSPSRSYVGIDKKQASLDVARKLATERSVQGLDWQLGDLFDAEAWLARIDPERPALFFSCHFHEFLAGGKEPVGRALRAFMARPSRTMVLILEQPRLELEEKARVSSKEWLYNHSNVLIHHLIRNAKILSEREWCQLLRDGRCIEVSAMQTECFGFRGYLGSNQ